MGYKAKRTIRRGASLNYHPYEDIIEVEYDMGDDGVEEWIDMIKEQLEKEVLEGATAWYNKIKETPEFKEQQQQKQNKGGYKPQGNSGGNKAYKSDFKKKGGNPYGNKQQQNYSGNTIKDPSGRDLKLNGSDEANQIVRDKLFGHAKQWEIILKKGIDPYSIEDYNDLQGAIKS